MEIKKVESCPEIKLEPKHHKGKVSDKVIITLKEDYLEIEAIIDGSGNTFQLPWDKIKEHLK